MEVRAMWEEAHQDMDNCLGKVRSEAVIMLGHNSKPVTPWQS